MEFPGKIFKAHLDQNKLSGYELSSHEVYDQKQLDKIIFYNDLYTQVLFSKEKVSLYDTEAEAQTDMAKRLLKKAIYATNLCQDLLLKKVFFLNELQNPQLLDLRLRYAKAIPGSLREPTAISVKQLCELLEKALKED